MRHQFTHIFVLLILLLAACGNGVTVGKGEETTGGVEQRKEVDEPTEDEESVNDIDARDTNVDEPLYALDGNWGLRPIGDANEKVVLLTIDDAPDKHALEMAKTLKKLNAQAIFFVNGHFLNTDEEKAVLQEIHEMGFAVGNHTKKHLDLQQLSEADQQDEILSVSNLVEEIIGERPKFFRAPFGKNTDFSKQLVADDGMLLMNWSFGYDWEKQYMDAQALADIMVNTGLMRDGANLLMHDREWTADALKDIVQGLRAKGYDFINPETIQGVE